MPFAKLDPGSIRNEALRLFREGGLDAVSLRRLAASLGVGVSSLYWHVHDKQALQAHLSEDIFRDCLARVPPATSWDAWLRGFGLSLWEAQTAMPDTRTLIIIAPLTPAAREGLRHDVVALLGEAGLPAPIAVHAQHSVQALVTGWTTLDHGGEGGGTAADRAAFLDALDVLIGGWQAARAAAIAASSRQALRR